MSEEIVLPNPLGFGTVYGSWVYQCDIVNGAVLPGYFFPIEKTPPIHPASPVRNYGLGLMDRGKGCQTVDGRLVLLRPMDHLRRIADGAKRVFGFVFDPTSLLEPLLELARLNHEFFPPHSSSGTQFFYIGFLLGALKPSLVLGIPKELTFTVFVSPVEPYFKDPLTVLATRMPPRVGYAKYIGNYGMNLLRRAYAREQKFGEIIHLDQCTGYIDDAGAATPFFILKNGSVFTPGLSRGTALRGITRASSIEVFEKQLHRTVIEGDAMLGELLPEVAEVLLCGTAVAIAPVDTLFYPNDWVLEDSTVDFREYEKGIWRFRSSKEGSITMQLRRALIARQTGTPEDDTFGWNVEVKL